MAKSHLWRFSNVPHFWGGAVDLVAASLGVNLLSLAVPITLMQVYDRIIPAEAQNTLWWLVTACAAALVLEGGLRWVRTIITAWMGARFEHTIGVRAVQHVLFSRLADFRKHSLGAHIDRLNAVGTLRTFYAGQVFQVILDVPFAFLFLYAVYFLAGPLVLFPIGAMTLFVFCMLYVKRRFRSVRELQETQNDRRFDFILELLGGIHFVKAQAFEEEMLRRYERLQGGAALANMEASGWTAFPTNVGVTFSQINMFGVIGLGAYAVINGQLTFGGLAACTLLASRAFQPVQQIASFLLRFSQAEIAKSRLAEIQAMPQDANVESPALPNDIIGAVSFRNVTFRHRPDSPTLFDGLNLTIAPREMVGIFGVNSSGTSTLLRLMTGVLKPESGNVYIDDYDIDTWDCSRRQGVIEYVPRMGTLFKGTIADNIAMFDHKRTQAAFDAAELLELDPLVASLPRGYETEVDAQAMSFLPAGMVQRICIARALVVRPRILLLDKCGEVMDLESQRVFERVLGQLKGHCTIVQVSNNTKYLLQADTVYRLQRGKLVERDIRSRVS